MNFLLFFCCFVERFAAIIFFYCVFRRVLTNEKMTLPMLTRVFELLPSIVTSNPNAKIAAVELVLDTTRGLAWTTPFEAWVNAYQLLALKCHLEFVQKVPHFDAALLPRAEAMLCEISQRIADLKSEPSPLATLYAHLCNVGACVQLAALGAAPQVVFGAACEVFATCASFCAAISPCLCTEAEVGFIVHCAAFNLATFSTLLVRFPPPLQIASMCEVQCTELKLAMSNMLKSFGERTQPLKRLNPAAKEFVPKQTPIASREGPRVQTRTEARAEARAEPQAEAQAELPITSQEQPRAETQAEAEARVEVMQQEEQVAAATAEQRCEESLAEPKEPLTEAVVEVVEEVELAQGHSPSAAQQAQEGACTMDHKPKKCKNKKHKKAKKTKKEEDPFEGFEREKPSSARRQEAEALDAILKQHATITPAESRKTQEAIVFLARFLREPDVCNSAKAWSALPEACLFDEHAKDLKTFECSRDYTHLPVVLATQPIVAALLVLRSKVPKLIGDVWTAIIHLMRCVHLTEAHAALGFVASRFAGPKALNFVCDHVYKPVMHFFNVGEVDVNRATLAVALLSRYSCPLNGKCLNFECVVYQYHRMLKKFKQV